MWRDPDVDDFTCICKLAYREIVFNRSTKNVFFFLSTHQHINLKNSIDCMKIIDRNSINTDLRIIIKKSIHMNISRGLTLKKGV